MKQQLRGDVYLLMLRGIAMFMMMGFAFFIVPLMAFLLTYSEIWRERVIGAIFGDPTRLYEYDPEDGHRSGTEEKQEVIMIFFLNS